MGAITQRHGDGCVYGLTCDPKNFRTMEHVGCLGEVSYSSLLYAFHFKRWDFWKRSPASSSLYNSWVPCSWTLADAGSSILVNKHQLSGSSLPATLLCINWEVPSCEALYRVQMPVSFRTAHDFPLLLQTLLFMGLISFMTLSIDDGHERRWLRIWRPFHRYEVFFHESFHLSLTETIGR